VSEITGRAAAVVEVFSLASMVILVLKILTGVTPPAVVSSLISTVTKATPVPAVVRLASTDLLLDLYLNP